MPALISNSYSAAALNTAQVSGGPWGGTSAGHGAGGGALAEQVRLHWAELGHLSLQDRCQLNTFTWI